MPSGIKQVFASKLTDVDTVKRDILGDIRHEGNKWYKYVEMFNTETIAGNAGDLVSYLATPAAGYDLNRVTTDVSDADPVPVCAGMLLAAWTGTLATSYYGWVQIKGRATLSNAVAATAAGKRFAADPANDLKGTVLADDFTAIAGVSLNATTAVLLDCPL